MSHLKSLGYCEYCKTEVISTQDIKDHTVWDVKSSDLNTYQEGQELKAKWSRFWCSKCISHCHPKECLCTHCERSNEN